MPQSVADVSAVNMEVLRKDLPTLYELEEKNTLVGMIKKWDNTQITRSPNGTDFRIPLEVAPPSDYGIFSVDGGSLGEGNASVNKQMYQTAFAHSIAVDLGFGAIASTENKGLSTSNTLTRNLRLAMQSFKRGQDAEFFSIGGGNQGLLALGTAYSTGTFTLDNQVGASLLQVGQPVEIFSNDLGTHRTSAVSSSLPRVASISPDRSQITLTNLGAVSPAATDYIAMRGVGSTPAAINGLRYFHSTATSGNLLGLSRSTYPELIPTSIDAGGALTPTTILQLSTKIFNRFNTIPAEMMGVINPVQAYQIYTVGIAISEWMRGKNDSMIDLVPKSNETTITIGGVSHLKTARQSKSYIDWIDRNNWGRVYIKELDFYTDPDGKQRWFEGRNSGGSVTANWKIFMVDWSNFFDANPGKEGFVYNASVPSGL